MGVGGVAVTTANGLPQLRANGLVDLNGGGMYGIRLPWLNGVGLPSGTMGSGSDSDSVEKSSLEEMASTGGCFAFRGLGRSRSFQASAHKRDHLPPRPQ